MEEGLAYQVEITPQAEAYFIELLDYLYKHHSPESADKKTEEILQMAVSLRKLPYRGRIEDQLINLDKQHRFLVYPYTSRKSVKIIYFIEEILKTVYVTDFFPTQKDEKYLPERSTSA